MQITNCQVYPIREPKGTLVAFARVLLEDCLQLTGIKLHKDASIGGMYLEIPKLGEDPLFGVDPTTENLILVTVVHEYRTNGGT